jgi:hypothetical protein
MTFCQWVVLKPAITPPIGEGRSCPYLVPLECPTTNHFRENTTNSNKKEGKKLGWKKNLTKKIFA